MSVLKLLKSKPMPDKNAPEYKERYEREVAFGRKFADVSGISWAARKLQVFANNHRAAYLIIVFGIVILCFLTNLSRLVISYRAADGRKAVATQRVDSALQQKKIHEMKTQMYNQDIHNRHHEEDKF
jgi:hypothetical protein